MTIEKEYELENLNREQLLDLLKQQITRSKLVVRRNGHILYRYDVSEDIMYLLIPTPKGEPTRHVFRNFSNDCPALIYSPDEHQRIYDYIKRIISEPDYPKVGAVVFTLMDGRRMLCEYSCTFDDEMNVRAIVGQHIDIFQTPERVQRTIQSLNEQSRTLSALKFGYETIILVNLTDFSFRLVQATDAVRKGAKNASDVMKLAEMFGKYQVHPDYQERYMKFFDPATLAERLLGQKSLSLNYLTRNIGWCHARIVPTEMDSRGNIIQAIVTTEIADSEVQQLSYLRVAAEHDSLTGLCNRHCGERRINELMQQGKRGILAIFDCDNFKTINDRLGHPTGDYVLIEVAKALKESFPDEVVMRLGGDEFVVYISSESMTSWFCTVDDSDRFFTSLRQRIAEIQIPQSYHTVSLSGGAILIPENHATTFEQIYPLADQQLYATKLSHKGNITTATL